MAKAKYKIVVDADIARSAGETMHPISSSCRKILDLILRNEHKFVACKKLRREWSDHSSSYATKWLASMIARKQVCFVENHDKIATLINSLELNEKNKAIALKDCHIVDVAIENGRFVTSRDDNAKAAFLSITEIHPFVRGITWANPVTDFDALKQKLHGNVPGVVEG
ncbi:hypothetical protein [Burkholderia cenocepacia]|uniref:hypothetical protein n=1 Tax=Burkholderia cenocepacia TaxID=95486 RepID=UPI001B9DD430|nr:hypothetical protein [Burkholderia cenocepacia]MBR7907568.1 hypothetical protein [Burkholderia cenocepacia]